MDHRRSNCARRNGGRSFGIAACCHPSALRSCLSQHRFRLPVGVAVHGSPGRREEALAEIRQEEESAFVASRALQSQRGPSSPAGRLDRLRTLHPERGSDASVAGTVTNPPDEGADHGRAGPLARENLFYFQGFGGAEGDRTPDLRNAIATLSQLSYGPTSSRP